MDPDSQPHAQCQLNTQRFSFGKPDLVADFDLHLVADSHSDMDTHLEPDRDPDAQPHLVAHIQSDMDPHLDSDPHAYLDAYCHAHA